MPDELLLLRGPLGGSGRSGSSTCTFFFLLFLLLLFAGDDLLHAGLGNAQRTGSVHPAFVGLHLVDALAALQHVAGPHQAAATLQTLVNAHVTPSDLLADEPLSRARCPPSGRT